MAFLCLGYAASFSQARIVLNSGGVINITNGAYLVIDNANSNAITRLTSGHIISEGINNRVKWNIGTSSTGTYAIPFYGGGTTYMPVSFTIATAGVGVGNFQVSTYGTSSTNTPYPTGIADVNRITGVDNSAYVVDRFWQIDALGYSTKPALSGLTFTYSATEIATPNTITENNLQMQRYNTSTSSWDWVNYPPAGTVNTAAKTVTVSSLSAPDFYSSWAMVDNTRPLPIKLIEFSAEPEEEINVRLKWATASELNNHFFTVQRSVDGIAFVDLATLKGSGTTVLKHQYTFLDIHAIFGRSYYRLKQTDYDGVNNFSNVFAIDLSDKFPLALNVYPNPIRDKLIIEIGRNLKISSLSILNSFGRTVEEIAVKTSGGIQIIEQDLSEYHTGFYLLKVVYEQRTKYIKLIKD